MDNQALTPLTACLGKVTLAAGTTSTLSNTGTIVFGIKGKAYSRAALSNTATPTTDWATGNTFLPIMPNYGSVFLIGLDSGGNLRAIQGTLAPLDSSGNFKQAPVFGGFGPAGSGSTDNDFCPIGYIIVKAGATASAAGWYFGVGNLATPTTGITITYTDVIGWPDRPQIS